MSFDLENAKDRGSRNPNFPAVEAQFNLEILNFRTFSGRSGDAFIATFRVLTSSTDAVHAGEEYDWYVSMATPKHKEYGAIDVRNLLQAIFGLKTEEEKLAHKAKYNGYFAAGTSAKQPFKGKKVRANTRVTEKNFTKLYFAPVAA